MRNRKLLARVAFGSVGLLAACSAQVGTLPPAPTPDAGGPTRGAPAAAGGAIGAGVGGEAGAAGGGRNGNGSAGDAGAGAGDSPGTGGSSAADGGADRGGDAGVVDPPAGYVPALIGVGYGGLRIVSRDNGKTWGDRAYAETNGGDDQQLLRAIVYGKGLWIATGWKLLTSTDGIAWIDHGLITDGNKVPGCTIVEGLAYKDGVFYAACTPWNAPGTVFESTDGLSWTKVAVIGDTSGHLFLTYRGGKLIAYGDTMTSYQSTDTVTWTVMPGVQQATYCAGAFASANDCLDSSWFDGVWLRADWQGKIARSTDGKAFSQVYLDDERNTLYQSRALAAGYVAPR